MTTGRRNAWLARTVAVLSLAAGLAGAASAQDVAGTLAGAVLDAETGLPLAGAAVTLAPEPEGVLSGHEPGGSPFLRATRSTATAGAGEYRFTGLSVGTYRLRFSRLGYRSASLAVELRGSGGSRVSVGLSVEPVRLEPLEVTSAAANPFGRVGSTATPDSRAAVARDRQARYLASDLRALTRSDVIQGVTLAETDLFRAVQRLPGVSGRDIWSAELWTRGAPWDQTRVYFDGIPLFNPVHGLGLFSGVNADAIGAAFLHPGVQPASLGGGAAGALELHSRRGGGNGEVRGAGELSLVSARLEVEQQRDSGRVAWMVAGRRTYVDLMTDVIDRLNGYDEPTFPYRFSDATFRLDRRIGRSSSLEVSATGALDAVTGGVPKFNDRSESEVRWGGGAGRATLSTPLGAWEGRQTLGFSGFASRSGVAPGVDPALDTTHGAPPTTTGFNRLTYASLSGELTPPGAAGASWRAGYDLIAERVAYSGPEPTPYSPSVPDLVPDTSWSAHLLRGALWTEVRGNPTERLAWDAGLRLEIGAGGVRAAPRLSARFRPVPALGLSATMGRTYQYEQALARGGLTHDDVRSSDLLWTLAGDGAPVIRSSLGTLGAEWWLDPRWLASATAYARHTGGVLVPDPTPGDLPVGWPEMVPAESDGRGLELSLRRLTGRWTTSLAYTLARTETTAAGMRHPAPGDRRQELDATALAQLGRWELGGAYSWATGAPYTRVYEGWATCEPLSAPGRCAADWVVPAGQEWPGAERGRSVGRLDLLASWSRVSRGWALRVFLQVHNALDGDPRNQGGYKSSQCSRSYPPDHETPCEAVLDDFLYGPPILPVLGARISF
jgi:hypothetical protein